jgi:hypothetical protein
MKSDLNKRLLLYISTYNLRVFLVAHCVSHKISKAFRISNPVVLIRSRWELVLRFVSGRGVWHNPRHAREAFAAEDKIPCQRFGIGIGGGDFLAANCANLVRRHSDLLARGTIDADIVVVHMFLAPFSLTFPTFVDAIPAEYIYSRSVQRTMIAMTA